MKIFYNLGACLQIQLFSILVLQVSTVIMIPYFFGYKTGFFSFQYNPKVQDPSCKMDLDLWHCLGRVELD